MSQKNVDYERPSSPRIDDDGIREKATAPPGSQQTARERHGHGHGRMMLLMCAPMLVLVTLLVISGTANASSFVAVLACVAMMALMMRGMGHGGDG